MQFGNEQAFGHAPGGVQAYYKSLILHSLDDPAHIWRAFPTTILRACEKTFASWRKEHVQAEPPSREKRERSSAAEAEAYRVAAAGGPGTALRFQAENAFRRPRSICKQVG